MELTNELLNILVCPETKAPLKFADQATISVLNSLVSAGKLINRKGATVKEPLEGGLIRVDDKIIYPIRDGIPIMLIDEGIKL